MRLPLVVMIALCLVPTALAEGANIRALGASFGWQQGVAGFQWDEGSAIGARYYTNETAHFEFEITTCVGNDARTFEYCEHHQLAP